MDLLKNWLKNWQIYSNLHRKMSKCFSNFFEKVLKFPINAKEKTLKQPKRLQVQIAIGTFPWAHCTTCFGSRSLKICPMLGSIMTLV
jgi:hypothetical protein